MTDTFPRQYARTQRLTLGEPRNITVSPDGQRVTFLRTAAGSDPVNALWVLDVDTGAERLVADPRALLAGGPDDEALPAAERSRRERAREGAGGIVAYATDSRGTVAAFALAGRLFGATLVSGTAREIVVDGPVFDPRPDPTGQRIAYVSGRSLRVAELDGRSTELAGPSLEPHDSPAISWGSAEFVAAEEMDRGRGYWWAPDGRHVAVTRVDTSAVQRWHIADPAHPEKPATEHAYPAAGTPNAEVTLHLLATEGGGWVDVVWDRVALPYLTSVLWNATGLLLHVQSRDQRRARVIRVDSTSGDTCVVFADEDDRWVELVPGSPSTLADGRLVVASDRGGARRLLVDGIPVTSPELQLRSIIAADEGVTFVANRIDEPTEQHVFTWREATGVVAVTTSPGVHGAIVGGDTVVVRSASLEHDGVRAQVLGGPVVASNAEVALLHPNVTLTRAGARNLATAVLLPTDSVPGRSYPVLVDPYGGPHAQRVLASRNAYLSSQWFADQGFAVVVIDGRGTPGRGTEFERAVHGDLATAVLDDQIDALHDAAQQFPELDLSKVAIRGWSFGGYLAALAVMRRPDVFHAAIAGAPVTNWRLYDTHYTERYLGDPNVDPDVYERSSLIADAPALERPLLLIHGLADDNVVAAHTLQLSSALLAAGRPHQVLPLSGVTHMTPQDVVAENLLLLQLSFLRSSLGIVG